jgi:cytochrome c-type biogenesis protein CcmH/NrfF
MLAVGTAIALMPETVFAFAAAKIPAGAVPAAMLMIAIALWPSAALAQSQTVRAEQRSALERRLETEIMCTCGCRRPLGSCGMLNCQGHASQTAKLKQFLAQGKDHDAVIAAFITDFGGEDVLAAPVDRGFNRLAWLFPYLVAVATLAGILMSARRWARPVAAPAGASLDVDPALSARLDDELRDLD